MTLKRWLAISLILIAVGAVMLIINQAVYLPRFFALRDATIAWTENHTSSTLPTPGKYGIDMTTFIVSGILGFGQLLIFIGAAYLVILLIAKILKKDSICPAKHSMP